MYAGGSLQYQTDVQGRFQFSEEIKDSSLKSLVVFIIAKRRVKSDTGWRGGGGLRRTICMGHSGSNHAAPVLQSFGDCAPRVEVVVDLLRRLCVREG